MKPLQSQVDELNASVGRRNRESSRFDVRQAKRSALKQGWWLGTLDSTLTFGGTATVSIEVWDSGALADTTLDVTAQDVLLTTGQTIAAGTTVQVRWYHNIWVVIPVGSGGGSPTLTGIYYYALPNAGVAPVPAYGVLWNAGSGFATILGIDYLALSSPFESFDISWYVNRDSVVTLGTIGVCDTLLDKPGPVRIDASLVGSINLGDVVGPKPNSYTVWPGYPGFTCTRISYLLGGVIPVVDAIQTPTKRVFGRLYQDITQNANGDATAEFEIWRRDTDGKRKVSGWEKISVYGTLLNKDEKASQGTFGWADYYSNTNAVSDGWEGDFTCDKDNTGSSQSVSPGAIQDQFANSPLPPNNNNDIQHEIIH